MTDPAQAPRRRRALGGWSGRILWALAAIALVAWQLTAGRSGIALLLAAGLLPASFAARELGLTRLAALLAPLLGIVGLAGAYPALAGQESRWWGRALLGALGAWWLTLAEPLLGRRLWWGAAGRAAGGGGAPLRATLAQSTGAARAAWEGSLSETFHDILVPLLTLATLATILLWALAPVLLTLVARVRYTPLAIALAVAWSAALLLAAEGLQARLAPAGAPDVPRGALLGAILAAALAFLAPRLRRSRRGPLPGEGEPLAEVPV